MSTVLGFFLLNVMAWVGLRPTDSGASGPNVVEDKYGIAALRRVYPGVAEADIKQLLDETWKLQRRFEPYVQFREMPFNGRFVNVHEAGFRHSKEQELWPPADDAFTIFFFGGSTTFGYGLADADTVPSQLQRLLRARGYPRVAVYNFGAGSYQSTQERIFFGEILARGVQPNMAIFLDGLNEFAFPHVPQDSDLIANVLANSGGRGTRRIFGILNALPIINLARQIMPSPGTRTSDNAEPAKGHDNTALIESVLTRYIANLTQLGAAARAAGATPVFVWQPMPYYKYNTAFHPFFDPGGVNRHASQGYTQMRERVRRQPIDHSFLWAADIQDGVDEPLYVDSVHYTSDMAERLAGSIVDHLLAQGLMRNVN